MEYVEYSRELGNEILLGIRESQAFGPVISFSKGGTDAEHFARHYSRPNLMLPPIDREWASALLASTHIQRKYLDEGHTGYLSAIVEAEVKLSDLATRFSSFFPSASRFAITELEVNPFAFDPEESFIALDGYAAFQPKGGSPPGSPVDLEMAPKAHPAAAVRAAGDRRRGDQRLRPRQAGQHHRQEPGGDGARRPALRQPEGRPGGDRRQALPPAPLGARHPRSRGAGGGRGAGRGDPAGGRGLRGARG